MRIFLSNNNKKKLDEMTDFQNFKKSRNFIIVIMFCLIMTNSSDGTFKNQIFTKKIVFVVLKQNIIGN